MSLSELNFIIKYLLTNRQFEGKHQVKRKKFEFIGDYIKYLGRRIFNFKSLPTPLNEALNKLKQSDVKFLESEFDFALNTILK